MAVKSRISKKSRISAKDDCAEMKEFVRYKDKLTDHVAEYKIWSRTVDVKLQHISESVPAMKEKLDNHINISKQTSKELNSKLDDVTIQVTYVKDTIDNVNANGNKGLNASLQDIYGKLQDLYTVTETARAKQTLRTSIETLFSNSFFLKTRVGRWISAIGVFLIGKFIADTMGLNFSFSTIIKWMSSFN